MIVVDDQPVVAAGFVAIIDAEPDLTVVGTAADGAAAVDAVARLRPDVVVMDIRMPGMDGITATRLLTARGGPRVLVLTTFDLDVYVFEALRAGASGFLLKDAEPNELLTAIRIVAGGESLLAPAVTSRLIAAFVAGPAGAAVPPPAVAGLTPREREVLRLVAQGLSNAEAAARLGVGVGTVKSHVNAVLGKLGVRDRVQATIVAYDAGLVSPRR